MTTGGAHACPPACPSLLQMGLGKSLESLMLVLSNPPPRGWAVTGAAHEPVQAPSSRGGAPRQRHPTAAAALRPARGSGGGDACEACEEDGHHPPAVPIRTTLLVAPATLVPQWAEEIRRHIVPGRLKW
jgi:SNF2 family DNA or RNA helicase